MAEATNKQATQASVQAKPLARRGVLAAVVKVFKDERNQLDIRKVNLVLYLVLAPLIITYVCLVAVWAHELKTLDLESALSADAAGSLVPVKEKQVLKSLASYTAAVKERNIFRMGRQAREFQESVSTKAQEATQSLRLVGISWSDNPDAMIEDTKAQKTYFVKKGQLINDLKVEAIYKDKVVLRFGQEQIELR